MWQVLWRQKTNTWSILWGLREQKSREPWQTPGASCQLVVPISKFWVQGETLLQKLMWRTIQEDSKLQPLIFAHLHTCASADTHVHTNMHTQQNTKSQTASLLVPPEFWLYCFELQGSFQTILNTLLSVYSLWCSHFNEEFGEKYINIWHIVGIL